MVTPARHRSGGVSANSIDLELAECLRRMPAADLVHLLALARDREAEAEEVRAGRMVRPESWREQWRRVTAAADPETTAAFDAMHPALGAVRQELAPRSLPTPPSGFRWNARMLLEEDGA